MSEVKPGNGYVQETTNASDGGLVGQLGKATCSTTMVRRAGQSFHLTCLDIDIEVRQLYRRLAVPVVVEQVEEESDLLGRRAHCVRTLA
ncbi:MAG TPA: hypothetical protein VH164_02105 [Ktedonobacteraceae bacterium]|jgi:hypothetical protein|nr:hypothetical protein [Ktedonobacteraceae bacterium]